MHVTSGSSGSGNWSVAYAVDANTSSSSRSGTMTVAGQTFMVMQNSTPSCTYAINPPQAAFGAAGGTGTVAVTAPSGCPWAAVSNAGWITVTSGTPGAGSGTVGYSVVPYTGKPRSRTGTMTIAGQTFTVKQRK
jgi:hypothetical protein